MKETMREIEPEDFLARPFHLLDKEWALLVAGKTRPNPMTVSWGGFGTLWNKPVVTVYVRPTRFTFCLLETEPEFTLNFLPPAMRGVLELCGSRSGRDLDKWEASGMKPVPSKTIGVPRVAGAELAFECRVVSSLNITPTRFLDPSLEAMYPEKDYHRLFLGEVKTIFASERFIVPGA
jgi:flavin reductase (DIM6/NTAB) family NADH-FMN oxidoreductase RutF